MLLPLFAFLLGMLGVVAVFMLKPAKAAAIDQRLREVTGAEERGDDVRAAATAAANFLKNVGEKAPRSAKEVSGLRERLVHAGFRRPESLSIFFAIRVGFALMLFGVFVSGVFARPNLVFALASLGLGWVLPGMVLARLAKRRQHRIQLALPDALDLLVVSVEAGLGLDQAMVRVGQELGSAYPDLSTDLRQVNLELLAGKARSEALRNLADRTGVDDLSALVAMLVQTDKFGTSVASSLRVFSETLRTKRRQRAEEAAAKTGVKMVFPLVLCIFPAIWVVTIGPAAIQFVKVLFPIIEGGQ
ncbi:MAG: type II secretion system F family protein [Vicinamibacterales bacterium]|jgi:tight adherence protein C|nr:type II secretion system F family protein [Vicinamibacterales bacterium]